MSLYNEEHRNVLSWIPALHCLCIRFHFAAVLNKFLFNKHLEADETLVRVVHKHWFLGIRSLFWPTLFFIGSIGLLTLVHTRGLYIVVSVLAVVMMVWWLRNFFDYYLDAWIITDHGIIDVEWFGWFHRQSTRVLYSDLEGISYEIKGIFGTLLRYGTLTIEKISTGSAVTLEYVSRPNKVEMLVLKYMETYVHSKNLKDSKQVQQLLATIVAEHIQMQQFKKDDEDDEQ